MRAWMFCTSTCVDVHAHVALGSSILLDFMFSPPPPQNYYMALFSVIVVYALHIFRFYLVLYHS